MAPLKFSIYIYMPFLFDHIYRVAVFGMRHSDSVYLDQVIHSPRYVEVCDDWLVIFQDVCGGILPQDTGEWNIQ
jgi:hypothetical protein